MPVVRSVTVSQLALNVTLACASVVVTVLTICASVADGRMATRPPSRMAASKQCFT